MSKVTIYHNPRCGKSRQTLTLLREQGIEPEVVEYLKTPPDEATIERLLDLLDIPVGQLIRTREYRDLSLSETDDRHELIARMAAHPQVIERPIVVCGSAARVGRPPECVLEIV